MVVVVVVVVAAAAAAVAKVYGRLQISWLLHVPPAESIISGTDLLRQFEGLQD